MTTAATTVGTVAGADLLWTCLIGAEVVAVLLMAWVAKRALDRWGPARLRGMATRAEVEQLLGRHRLRRNRTTIRPDLYPSRGHLARYGRRYGRPVVHPSGQGQQPVAPGRDGER